MRTDVRTRRRGRPDRAAELDAAEAALERLPAARERALGGGGLIPRPDTITAAERRVEAARKAFDRVEQRRRA